MPNGDDLFYAQQEAAKDRERLNLATRLLCQLYEGMEQDEPEIYHYYVESQPELLRWWEDHKRADEEQEASVIQHKQDRVDRLEGRLAEVGKELKSARKDLQEVKPLMKGKRYFKKRPTSK